MDQQTKTNDDVVVNVDVDDVVVKEEVITTNHDAPAKGRNDNSDSDSVVINAKNADSFGSSSDESIINDSIVNTEDNDDGKNNVVIEVKDEKMDVDNEIMVSNSTYHL